MARIMVADSDLHMLKEIKFRFEPKSNGIGAFKGEMSVWDRIGLWVMRKFFLSDLRTQPE